MNIMGNVQGHASYAFNYTADCAAYAGAAIYQAVSPHVYNAIDLTQQACIATINKIEAFLFEHRETLLFTGCCLTTAYLAPHLFFPAAIAAIIVRVELARNLRNAAEYYLKDERNPYKLNPQYNACISAVDLTLGVIAAVDSVAIGTILMCNFWTISFMPILGGVAAGSCLAKMGMNATHFLG